MLGGRAVLGMKVDPRAKSDLEKKETLRLQKCWSFDSSD